MSKIKIEYPPGATPLDPDELADLIPDYITTRGELNLLERENIIDAANWVAGKKHTDILNPSFIYELHKKMFNRVWKWAGRPRNSDKNIGVAKEQIQNQLKMLIDDTAYWIANKTYSWDEIGARFHRRLVWVHIFPNGNGRHSRLMTDALLEHNGQEPFSWGESEKALIDTESETRSSYITALKAADYDDYEKLLKFVRS